ncbi:hypothetical protein GEMRC1_000406 [Eukaryota sp. GEM-RC1]
MRASEALSRPAASDVEIGFLTALGLISVDILENLNFYGISSNLSMPEQTNTLLLSNHNLTVRHVFFVPKLMSITTTLVTCFVKEVKQLQASAKTTIKTS